MENQHFTPGNIIRARGREWIVLNHSNEQILRIRPVSGSEMDATLIYVPLEKEAIQMATFSSPEAWQMGGHESAVLLRDALVLSMRRGAGPFRSFGQIAVEPRAYQLVPLLMALKLDPIRLLIADDVGIGKTIESALILREMLDRGEIQNFTVLCPPHLVNQWCEELENRFHLQPEAVTDATVRKLERGLPPGESLFSTYPQTVVSLDYIKTEKRRDEFARACPKFVIVDEAHTCTLRGNSRNQRFELLKKLSEDKARHMLLLTATPHSGDESAFYNMLSLLKPEFGELLDMSEARRKKLREEGLAQHFVQRRRVDIDEWKDNNVFPQRETTELSYLFKDKARQFMDDVLDYCHDVVETSANQPDKRHNSFFGTLALMRCVSSSPAAALHALRVREQNARLTENDWLKLQQHEASELENECAIFENRLLDADPEQGVIDDLEPDFLGDSELHKLVQQAQELCKSGDSKLNILKEHLKSLISDGFKPVVFCRYIATAHYLAEKLGKWEEFSGKSGVVVSCVTGLMPQEQRAQVIEELENACENEKIPILIATDCLSEGINLQNVFTAVVHYDLSWNPTRHEQREGRVDRFGQKARVVRSTLMYGENNPVDGAVLEVILKKAEKIQKELGVPVPIPEDSDGLSSALLEAILLRRNGGKGIQLALDFGDEKFDTKWTNAAEKMKKNRTVFAQRRIHPDEVLPEWKKSLAALGTSEDVERFTQRSLAYLNCRPEKLVSRAYKVPLLAMPIDLRERLELEGMTANTIRVDFDFPAHPNCMPIQRCHPLVSVLAETYLEHTLNQQENVQDQTALGRVGIWKSDKVQVMTTIVLIRMRHQLTVTRYNDQKQNALNETGTQSFLVEEAGTLAWTGVGELATLISPDDAAHILDFPATGDLPSVVRERKLNEALQFVENHKAQIHAYANERAASLLEDHKRIRDASNTQYVTRVTYRVEPMLPVDVIGVFVVLPAL